jgi:o-succinylbenzoate synthase
MRIDRVVLTHVRIPLVTPRRLNGCMVAVKDSILVTVHAEGITGTGEASPADGALCSPGTPGSIWDDLTERIIPAITSMRPRTLEDVCGVLEAIDGNCYARAGAEAAFWDIEAQRVGVPLSRLLGGSRTKVETVLVVGNARTIPELMKIVEPQLEGEYRQLKIMVEPGWDLEPLKEVRRRFGDVPLMVDANGAYSREHFDHLSRFDEYSLTLIEQPLPADDLEGIAQLQELITTPVCLDEAVDDAASVQQAIDAGACRVVNIKVQQVGGLRNAVRIHNICAAAGIPVRCGAMPELGIGGAQSVHLATLPNFRYPAEVQASGLQYVEDLIVPLLEVHGGEIQLPLATGSAYQVANNVVTKYMVRREIVV